MRATTQRVVSNLTALTIASAIALAFAAPAHAGKREPAPITFIGSGSQGTPAGNSGASQSLPGRNAAAPADRATKKIEFRYPDQPNIVQGNDGPRELAGGAPIAFSSSKSAISPDAARQYASVQAPVMSQPAIAADPAISAGGFDARAAAAKIEANRKAQIVETASLAPVPFTAQSGQGVITSEPALVGKTAAAAYAAIPDSAPMFDETGVGIVYSDEFDGLPTANGELFSQAGMTAAHPSLPLPSLVQVVNLDTGKEVVVRVNDRGPFEDGASLQLSQRAASVLDFRGAGKANVRVRYLGPAPIEGEVLAGARLSAPQLPAIEPQRSAPVPAKTAPIAVEQTSPMVQAVSFAAPVGAFYVQVGSFSDISNAQSLQSSLGRGLPVEIQQARVNGGDWFRVRVGPVDSRATAESLRNRLAEFGIADGRIVSDQ